MESRRDFAEGLGPWWERKGACDGRGTGRPLRQAQDRPRRGQGHSVNLTAVNERHRNVSSIGESEDGESEDGESEDGESEDGESEDGESEDGESEDGECEDGRWWLG